MVESYADTFLFKSKVLGEPDLQDCRDKCVVQNSGYQMCKSHNNICSVVLASAWNSQAVQIKF